MNPEIKLRVEKIMGLAYELNPTNTRKDEAGYKPTVFVNFSGHVSLLEVRIHKTGWKSGSEGNYYDIYLSNFNTDEEIIKNLDNAIAEILNLKVQWEKSIENKINELKTKQAELSKEIEELEKSA